MTTRERSFYDLILSKRDTRLYAERALPEETLRRILQAGRMAGSARSSQPVRFILVRAQAQKDALARCGDSTRQLPPAAAAVAIVLLPDQGQFDPLRATCFDGGRAAQNMMLTAWSEGITSCPVTMHRGADAARVLGLPEGHEIEWVLCFGYPGGVDSSREPRPRLPFEDFAFGERWGEGLSEGVR